MAPALISCSTMSVWPSRAAITRGISWSTFGGWEVERMQLWLMKSALRKINHMGQNKILTKVLAILSSRQEERLLSN